MKKKLISLILLLSSTTMTLASCGGRTDTTITTNDSTSIDTSSSSSTTTVDVESENAKVNITLAGDDGVTLTIIERDNSTGYILVGMELGNLKTISNIRVVDSSNTTINHHRMANNTRIGFSINGKDVTVNVSTTDMADTSNSAVYQGILDWTKSGQQMSFTNTLSGDYSVEHVVKYYSDDNYTTFRIENSSYNESLYDYFKDSDGDLVERYLGLDNTVTERKVLSTLNQPIEFDGSIYSMNLLKMLLCTGEDSTTGDFTFPTTDSAALQTLKSRLGSSASYTEDGDIVFNYYPDSSSDYGFFMPYFLMKSFNAFYGYYVNSYDFKVQITINSYAPYSVKGLTIELNDFTITTTSGSGLCNGKIVFNEPSSEPLEADDIIPLTGTVSQDYENSQSFTDSISLMNSIGEGNYTLDIETENIGSDGYPAGYTANYDLDHKYTAKILSYLSDDEATKTSEGYSVGTTTSNFMQVSNASLYFNNSSSSTVTNNVNSKLNAIYGINDGNGKINNASMIAVYLNNNKDVGSLLSTYSSSSSTTSTPFYIDKSALYHTVEETDISKLMITNATSSSLTLGFKDKGVNTYYISQELLELIDSPLDFAFGQSVDARLSDYYKILSTSGVIESVEFLPDVTNKSLTINVKMGTTLTSNGSTTKYNTSTTLKFTKIGTTPLSDITSTYSKELEVVKSTYSKQA